MLIDANLLLFVVHRQSPFHARARSSTLLLTPLDASSRVSDWLDRDVTWIPQPTERHRDVLGSLGEPGGARGIGHVSSSRRRRKRGITGYTALVAKVMISLPDDLLARVDSQAAERGATRSATIRELAEAALGERERSLGERMAALEGFATGHGGDVVGVLKAGRPA